ncbi:MAG: MBL fold metallo-hydrolase [Cellulosilyticaceae bacterium]
MKLKVLVDNNTYIDHYYEGEPAVSYYIEDKGTKILFDTGYSDLFMRNATAFGIDLNTIQKIVISHGHDDHTRGLKYYFEKDKPREVELYAHPHTFKEKVLGELKICSPLLEKQLQDKCRLHLTKEPIQLSENIILLGEIPQTHAFEQRCVIGKQKIGDSWEDDYVIDDTALVYKSSEGIYIITGCSHSGICNIIEYAKKICNEERVVGVIGGLHLFEVSHRVEETITYFKENQIKEIYPCHCTSLHVKCEMYKTLPIKEVGVGLELEW